MAKYNILREDEEISKEKNEKEKSEDTQEQKTNDDETAEFSPGPKNNARRTPGEEFFTDDIFSAIEADKTVPEADTFEKEEIDNSSPEEAGISEMDFPSEEETEKFVSEEELPAPQQDFSPAKESTERPIYDYEDDYKQEGINYKPILIGAGIVVAIVVIYFVVSSVFFGDDITEPETKVETAAEKLQREQEEQKQNFLAEISKKTNHRLSAVNLLTDLDK